MSPKRIPRSLSNRARPLAPGALAAAALALGALAPAHGASGTASGTAMPEVSTFEAEEAIAILQPTRGNEVRGTVEFRETPEGLTVSARVEGLAPGRHGYHVHLYGDCSAPDGTSAGTHFNFLGLSKDLPADIDRITGNLGELEAKDDGRASAGRVVARATLEGPYSIVGRAVVVHARGNDPAAPPMGDAGGRVACGVIGLAG